MFFLFFFPQNNFGHVSLHAQTLLFGVRGHPEDTYPLEKPTTQTLAEHRVNDDLTMTFDAQYDEESA